MEHANDLRTQSFISRCYLLTICEIRVSGVTRPLFQRNGIKYKSQWCLVTCYQTISREKKETFVSLSLSRKTAVAACERVKYGQGCLRNDDAVDGDDA